MLINAPAWSRLVTWLSFCLLTFLVSYWAILALSDRDLRSRGVLLALAYYSKLTIAFVVFGVAFDIISVSCSRIFRFMTLEISIINL